MSSLIRKMGGWILCSGACVLTIGSMLAASDVADSLDGSGMGLRENLIPFAWSLQSVGAAITFAALCFLPAVLHGREIAKAAMVGGFTAFLIFVAGARIWGASSWLEPATPYPASFKESGSGIR